MGRRNRETLKNFFRNGALPSEENFHDLIDSALNMNDEGFDKSPEHGFEILAQGRRPSLLSFFRDDDPADPVWRLALDEVDRRRLLVWDQAWLEENGAGGSGEGAGDDGGAAASGGASEGGGEARPTLTLGPGARVGVNTADPQRELDVAGFVRARGREGVVPDRPAPGSAEDGGPAPTAEAPAVLADGAWHAVTAPLDGCHALEVVAGVGLKGSGRYALLHAIAINTYHPTGFLFDFFRRKKKIRVTQGYYRSRSDRLALRWASEDEGYVLQIRTRRDYGRVSGSTGPRVRIRYHVTELWSDTDMSGAWNPPAE